MELTIYGRDRLRREIAEDMLMRQGLAFRRAEGPTDGTLVLLSDALLEGRDFEMLRAFVREGGRALFLAPEPHGTSWVGEELPYTFPFPYLRMASEDFPFLYIQVPSSSRLVRQRNGEAWAHFALGFSTTVESRTSRYPAIVWGEEGKGRWGVFLYDLPAALLVSHQGYEFFASDGDFPMSIKDGKARSVYLFNGVYSPELLLQPQPSFHEHLVVRMLRRLADDFSPLPRVWYYPYPHTTCILLSGDSDNLEKESLIKAWGKLSAWEVPYTQFTMPEDLSLFSPEEVSEWREQGIDFGLHYYHGEDPSEEEMTSGLGEDRRIFSSKGLELLSARGHSLIWVGWDAQVRAFQANGIRVDSSLNYTWDPRARAGEGLPFRLFLRGGVSEVYEVPLTGPSDDAACHDKSGYPPMKVEEALFKSLGELERCRRLTYQPLNLLFHPHYFVGRSSPDTSLWVEGMVERCRKLGIPIYDIRTWMEFWWRREKVVVKAGVEGDVVRLEVSGPASGTGIALPSRWAGKGLRAEGVKLAATDEVLVPAWETGVRYG